MLENKMHSFVNKYHKQQKTAICWWKDKVLAQSKHELISQIHGMAIQAAIGHVLESVG
jgi:hypothetical protein